MKKFPIIAWLMHYGIPSTRARAAMGLGVALAIIPASFADADVHVSGSRDAVSISAENASIKEILAALGSAFDVHYQSMANLETQITGTYEGKLYRVLMRVLDGYNVILKTDNGRTEITVLGTRNSAVASGSSPLTAAKTASVPAAAPARAASSSPRTEGPTGITPVAPSSLGSNGAEPPAPAASRTAPVPTILLAEGPMPPLPSASSPGSVPTPVPESRPSTVAPPSPTTGATPGPIPEGRPTAAGPQVPGAAADAPQPQDAAGVLPPMGGTTNPPDAGNPISNRLNTE